ncbi:hypothetical protein, partial [Streptomyces fumanus]|uniref:hypothetical protein n=1 Tax=Streptomyces fumanus TaxID=67302 RepID=UPI003407477C
MAYANANLLSVAGSTFEGNAHTYSVDTNCTLSVVSGQSLTGTYSLRATATAAGSISFLSPMVSPVLPNVTYAARVPIRVNTATAG